MNDDTHRTWTSCSHCVCQFPYTLPLGGIVTGRRKRNNNNKKILAKLNLDEKHKTWLFRCEWRNSLHAREIISPIWDVAAINEKRCISNLQSWTTQWIKKHISHEAVGVTASLVQADYRYPWIRHWAKKTVKEASFTEMLRVWHHSL